MKPGVYIIGSGISGLFDPLDPEGFTDSHPAWKKDANRLSPWIKTKIRKKGESLDAWRSQSCDTNSAVLICGRCSSTMDVLHDLIDTVDLAPWDCLLAVEQEKGRGQRQRTWISPPGNLYASWYWPNLEKIEGADPGWKAMASLMAGELVATVLESFGAEVSIKWPNDLLADNRKVCGILVENRGGHLIVGIGMNLVSAPPGGKLTDAFAVEAASLKERGLDISPAELWLRLAETGPKRVCSLVQSMMPGSFVELVQSRLAWKESRVTVRKSRDEAFAAVIKGLSPDGGLVIEKNGKTEVIYTGSILPEENLLK
ncbi:MAG: biotin--[acetyl-CoA-carboxylase] ligase [Desulfobacteraceae bacterium]|nr:biotin--[acetyl-CoA-carboxylase] ligase [Desulfobacteraceae bacterium]